MKLQTSPLKCTYWQISGHINSYIRIQYTHTHGTEISTIKLNRYTKLCSGCHSQLPLNVWEWTWNRAWLTDLRTGHCISHFTGDWIMSRVTYCRPCAVCAVTVIVLAKHKLCCAACVCARGVRHMEQWLAVIRSSKRHACLTTWPEWWSNMTLYGQYKIYALLWLTCVQGQLMHISDEEHVMQGWPLLEVTWTYVLLKHIYLTSNLNVIYIIDTTYHTDFISVIVVCLLQVCHVTDVTDMPISLLLIIMQPQIHLFLSSAFQVQNAKQS